MEAKKQWSIGNKNGQLRTIQKISKDRVLPPPPATIKDINNIEVK